jgi:hypothetical protein
MLQTFEGVIQRGHVRLPAGTPLRDGARVIVTVLPTVDEHRARRKANGWLGEHVGNMVMAWQPALALLPGHRQIWRFGAFVGSLSSEPFGPIGFVDVDAETGQVLTNEEEAEQIARRGERLERVEAPE